MNLKNVLLLCRKAGIAKLGHVAVDGSKIQGNASKHKAMSYETMQQLEKHLETEIAGLLARAEEADATDDERLGEDVDEVDIPAELQPSYFLQLAKSALFPADLRHSACFCVPFLEHSVMQVS